MRGKGRMDILSFILYCFIVTATPGPAVVMILSTVNNFGTKKGIEFVLGVTAAFASLIFLSASVQLFFAAAVTSIGFVSCMLWVVFGSVFRKIMIKYRTILNRIMALFLAYSAVAVSGAVDFIKGYFSG